ncbi:NADPH quinone reductase [Lentilactobacillus otakiensis DSM 19908 = JCM 15040]|uniref:NADPH:quinone reductase n=2 Tax=Lentilactobacillus otakiensis TaxID=481720 RepID=S4NE67_9LACO|nr:NADPH quinone reductase [Lentilactobacillus otakiensis DSM 19908 = JCM 15040]MBZ3777449.1 NADP-dependent oxidoreductase [Lentilactobacillus otakiensis]GAD17194.1 NADPH:quinone reductase [Lentilactobacillus otakiensis DSM 19908 = JCM 15040]
MKAAQIQKYGQQRLDIVQVPIPVIRDNDVLVKVAAASINPIDLKTRDGQLRMLLKYKMPLTLGSDFSGTVTKVGKSVVAFHVGDQVYGRVQKNRIGTFAEYVGVDQGDIALKPVNLTLQDAAAIPLVALTSYQALVDVMQVNPGDKILIQAGSGGIGTMAIPIAKSLGAFVATTTSAKNAELVRKLGADQVIDYHQTHFEDVLVDYDYVFDTLGGQALINSFRIVKPGGKIVSISGMPNGRFAKNYGLPGWKRLALSLATMNIARLERRTGVEYDFLFMKPSGRELTAITTLIEQGVVKPIIDRVVPFEDIQSAFDYSASGRAKGKILVAIG